MKFLLLLLGLLTFGCASSPQNNEETSKINNSQVYRYSYDNVWRATQVALQAYPIKVNNSEKGIIHTEFIEDGEIWTHPTQKQRSNVRYQLKIRAIRGVIRSKPAIKIAIDKILRKQKNFIEGSSEESSRDYLEEAVLLYRIKRELIIDHALNKLQQKE